jgi:Arc/MetJ-type ribon-helix-helix transcriptional regulator
MEKAICFLMRSPIRVTISFDEPTYAFFESLKKELRVSQSEVIRRAIRFYHENRATVGSVDKEKAREYVDMLADGEHVILDVDHWLLFLKTIETSKDQAEFWETHREIARSHAEQLGKKITSPQALLLRLEACNLFKLSHNGDNEFTLMTGPGTQRRFIREFLEETFSGMGFDAIIKEDYSKLRVVLNGNGKSKE